MADVIKLNIFQKLQKSRVELQKKAMKKSGENKFSHYNYFELGDFLPSINELCDKFGLATIFSFEDEKAKLQIIDVDNLESKLEFSTPIKIAELKGCSYMQSIGGTQTYARRYLYIMAFEIAENDTVDGGGGIDQLKEDAKYKINKINVKVIKDLIQETGTDTKKFLQWAEVDKVENISNEGFVSCIKMLEKKKSKAEQPAQPIQEDFEF